MIEQHKARLLMSVAHGALPAMSRADLWLIHRWLQAAIKQLAKGDRE